MALDSKNLSVLAYANGFTLWHYATADSAEAVGASGYFDEASEMLTPGDMILANVGHGAAFYLVSSDINSVAVHDLLAANAPEPGGRRSRGHGWQRMTGRQMRIHAGRDGMLEILPAALPRPSAALRIASTAIHAAKDAVALIGLIIVPPILAGLATGLITVDVSLIDDGPRVAPLRHEYQEACRDC